ncbi:MAG: family 16 glycoside hydrolase [Planctomycetota bacterium]|nr:family 16 glycoside hydrolase [Planctomycetota bacterium]
MLRSIALSSILFAAPNAALIAADSNGKGPAFTSAPENDPNFVLMGEFIGDIQVDGKTKRPLGLQIRHTGHGSFEALSFLGGLPGQEGHESKPMKMIGQRSEDFVVLSGGPWAIFVEKDHCLLLSRKGQQVGKLARIHRVSPTLGAPAPESATVLFDGSNVDHFTTAQISEDGLLMEGADVKPMFQDFNLQVEFRLPYMPQADGQARGNSGLYLQSRYECQVLDSFATTPVHDGLGSLYKFKVPDLNMAFPPLSWQTYDVQFTAPRWAADGTKIRDAHVTSWVNGVKVQNNVALPNKTGAGKPEEPILLPIRLQNHGDPVRYRNIWIIDRGLASGEFPILPTPEQLIATANKDNAKKKEVKAEKLETRGADEKPAVDKKPVENKKPAIKAKAEQTKKDIKPTEAKATEPAAKSEAVKKAEDNKDVKEEKSDK